MRINCPTPRMAAAIADFLTTAGYGACWLISYATDAPQVITDADRNTAQLAANAFGLGV